jgi:bile acid:Na+ symporter, BASS family
MTASNIILISVIISVLLIVFALGARSTPYDALYLFRHPALLFRSMAALYIVVPAFAVAVCLLFNLSTPVKFALIALSVSPIPPVLPVKEFKSGGDEAYVIGLLIAASLFALVVTPLAVSLAAYAMNEEAAISPFRVARSLLISVGIPLAAGMLVKAYAPRAAEIARKYTTIIGIALLVLGSLAILVAEWRAILSLIGDGSVLAMAAMVGVGLLAGHLLEGGSIGRRTSLAISAATRHPGVAIAIATLNFPDLKRSAVAAILLFFLVNALVSIPYLRWAKGQVRPAPHGAADETL